MADPVQGGDAPAFGSARDLLAPESRTVAPRSRRAVAPMPANGARQVFRQAEGRRVGNGSMAAETRLAQLRGEVGSDGRRASDLRRPGGSSGMERTPTAGWQVEARSERAPGLAGGNAGARRRRDAGATVVSVAGVLPAHRAHAHQSRAAGGLLLVQVAQLPAARRLDESFGPTRAILGGQSPAESDGGLPHHGDGH